MSFIEKAIVIIPTFNEKQNVSLVIKGLKELDSRISILVVDDNSPDGTPEEVRRLQRQFPQIYLIVRDKKRGLGTAYVEGFKFALKEGYQIIIQMDADLSHDISYLPEMLRLLEEYDLVIGSRYIKGVRVHNWPFKRLLLSKFANIYVRWVTGLPLEDSTSGYKCMKRKVLENIDIDSINSQGYAFQIEMVYQAYIKGFRISEYPIMFKEREGGFSKMTHKIVWEAFWKVWELRLKTLFCLWRR